MIMSPFVLDKNVPLIRPPRGGQIEADGDEQERVGEGGSAGAGAQSAVAGGRRGAADARELPAGEATVEAVWGGRRRGSAAPQRRTAIASRARGEISAEGAAAGAGGGRGGGGGAGWGDPGGRALGVGGWTEGRCRNAATLDVGGGFVEPGAEASATPSSAGAQRALWGAGADGWELSRLAGGARPARLFDRYGG